TTIWLGSVTCGLLKFNPVTHEVHVYDRGNGLVNSHIGSLIGDNYGRIWLVTEGGLSCFDRQTETFINYSPKKGLPVLYPTARFFYDTAGQCLYNGGHGYYFYFYPARVRPGGEPPAACITSVLVNGKPWIADEDGPFGFPSQQNDISIQYT